MKVAERATPVAAVLAALSTMACCLPCGFLGAVGLAGASVRLQEAQPVQHRAVLGRCCNSSPDYSFPASHRELGCRLSDCMRVKMKYVPLFIVAALACLVFWYFWGSPPKGQPPLTSLTPNNLDQFKREFNEAADRNRLVLL